MHRRRASTSSSAVTRSGGTSSSRSARTDAARLRRHDRRALEAGRWERVERGDEFQAMPTSRAGGRSCASGRSASGRRRARASARTSRGRSRGCRPPAPRSRRSAAAWSGAVDALEILLVGGHGRPLARHLDRDLEMELDAVRRARIGRPGSGRRGAREPHGAVGQIERVAVPLQREQLARQPREDRIRRRLLGEATGRIPTSGSGPARRERRGYAASSCTPRQTPQYGMPARTASPIDLFSSTSHGSSARR